MSSESDNAMTSSTVSKLAEARRTTYLSGRWVCDDQNGDTSISITGPWITLPNNGDYSAYYNWVEEKKTTQGPGKEQYVGRHLEYSGSHRACMPAEGTGEQSIGCHPDKLQSELSSSMEISPIKSSFAGNAPWDTALVVAGRSS